MIERSKKGGRFSLSRHARIYNDMTEEQIVEQLYKALQLLEDDCPGLAKMKIMFLIGELE
jgi:hypothetical protein